MAQYGNSIIAIVAGQLANRAASFAEFAPIADGSGFYLGGFLGPFDVSLVALVLCGTLATALWDENFGERGDDDDDGKKSSAAGALKGAFAATVRSPDILSCGIISSLFEGSMYVFVFMWTPCLTALAKEEAGEEEEFDGLPFGVIFSTFMVCCMAGEFQATRPRFGGTGVCPLACSPNFCFAVVFFVPEKKVRRYSRSPWRR